MYNSFDQINFVYLYTSYAFKYKTSNEKNVMSKRESITIRIDMHTKAALDMISAERQLVTGKNVTQNEAIWYLVEIGAKHIADRIRELTQEDQSDGEKPASD
jgi:hypothetical protein